MLTPIFTTEISSRNLPFVKKQNDCWQFQHLLNQLGTLDHIEVKDTWFDKLELYVENKKESARRSNTQDSSHELIKLELSGRYLVRAVGGDLPVDESEKRDLLIDLNSKRGPD